MPGRRSVGGCLTTTATDDALAAFTRAAPTENALFDASLPRAQLAMKPTPARSPAGNATCHSAWRKPRPAIRFHFSGSRLSRVNADTQLGGRVLLADHVILSGFAGYSNATGYSGFVIGLFISIPFGARQGVFSVDLTDSKFRPFNVSK